MSGLPCSFAGSHYESLGMMDGLQPQLRMFSLKTALLKKNKKSLVAVLLGACYIKYQWGDEILPWEALFSFFIHTSMNLKVYKTIKTFAAFLFDTKTQVFTTRLWSFIPTEEVHFMLWSYSVDKELCCCLTCINETGSPYLSFWLKWLTPLLLKNQVCIPTASLTLTLAVSVAMLHIML